MGTHPLEPHRKGDCYRRDCRFAYPRRRVLSLCGKCTLRTQLYADAAVKRTACTSSYKKIISRSVREDRDRRRRSLGAVKSILLFDSPDFYTSKELTKIAGGTIIIYGRKNREARSCEAARMHHVSADSDRSIRACELPRTCPRKEMGRRGGDWDRI